MRLLKTTNTELTGFPKSVPLLRVVHLLTRFCWRIACHSLSNIQKFNYNTCTNIPASVPLILPPNLWQHCRHIGTQAESLLPTIRAPHLRLSEQQSHKPQKNQLSFAILFVAFYYYFCLQTTSSKELFLIQFSYAHHNA